MGIYPTSADNSLLYFDKIHPTALGYSYFGPLLSTYDQARRSLR
jgi:hypothetical protein